MKERMLAVLRCIGAMYAASVVAVAAYDVAQRHGWLALTWWGDDTPGMQAWAESYRALWWPVRLF